MKTIKNEISFKNVINKSIFICILTRLDNIDDFINKYNVIKNTYKGATHYCYAYIVDTNVKQSDDNEPSGSAGIPILNVLLKNGLDHVLCVVVRYFGGIKLGVGGLLRAYSNSVSILLDKNKDDIVTLLKGYKIVIETEYKNQKDLDYILRNSTCKKTFGNNISYEIYCNNDIKNVLESKYDLKSIENIYI